jgi:hypothetical protein
MDLHVSPPARLASLRRLHCFVDLTNMDVSPETFKEVCDWFRIEPEIHDENRDLVACASLSLYISLNSQTDDYRMMRHLSREVWRSVDTPCPLADRAYLFPLTQPPTPWCNDATAIQSSSYQTERGLLLRDQCSVCQKYERCCRSGYQALSSFPSSRSLSIFRRMLLQR